MPFELFGDFPVSSSWIGTVSAAPVNGKIAVVVVLLKPTKTGTNEYGMTLTPAQWLGVRVDILANETDGESIGAEIGKLMKQRNASPLN